MDMNLNWAHGPGQQTFHRKNLNNSEIRKKKVVIILKFEQNGVLQYIFVCKRCYTVRNNKDPDPV